MTSQSSQVWYYIIGGGFLGFWLYLAFLPEPQSPNGWVLWGMLGIAIAAAFYAGRLANDQVRIGIWIFTGIFLGFLVAAAVSDESPAIIATFITGVGAGLIAAGLPPYPERPAVQAPQGYQQPPVAPHARHPPQEPHAGSTEWQPSEQRQQQGVTVYGPQYR